MERICECCGSAFKAARSRVEKGTARYCSMKCRRGMNEVRIDGDTAYVYLTGRDNKVKAVAKIDAADVPKLQEFGKRWSASWLPAAQQFRAVTRLPTGLIFMHRWLTDAPGGVEVDHINHDMLDNHRDNLRFTTRSQNMQNRRKANANTRTGIRNVNLTAQGTYLVQVKVNYVRHHIGTFKTLSEAEEAAIRARQQLMTHSMD